MKVSINRQLLGIEDLLLGEGTVTQPRGSIDVTVTKINAQNLPWGPIEGQTYAEAIEEKVQRCEDAAAVVEPLMANIDNINYLANNIGSLELIVTNLPEILLADDNATISTTKASEASASAITATTQAGIATTQAGIATTKALEASTSADTATTQAGLASTAKDQAEAYSATCLAIANFDFAGFTVVDGELIVSTNDLGASTASLVDGELILTY